LAYAADSDVIGSNQRREKQAMLKRLVVILALVAGCAAPRLALALNLTAQLFPLTGEVRFRNTSGSAVPLLFYSIKSSSGALNGANWVWFSVEDRYDLSGNGLIDPNGEWFEISATSMELTEGALDADAGSLAAFRSVSLGEIWTASPSPDLVFDVREPSTSPITITTQLALAGDYFVDGVVNQQDYLTWRQTMGSTTLLNADGNLNGVVDAADFVIWKHNFGNMLPGTGLAQSGGLVAGSAVPEPAAIGLAIIAGLSLILRRKRGN
jgi:hypothetical protein